MNLNDFKYMIKEAVTRYLEFNAPCLEVRVLLGLLLVVGDFDQAKYLDAKQASNSTNRIFGTNAYLPPRVLVII